MIEFQEIRAYQEALDELEVASVQWMANYKYSARYDFIVDDEGIEKMLNNSRMIQTLIDAKSEQLARRFKLSVGSSWECLVDCMVWNREADECFELSSGNIVSINAVFESAVVFADDFACSIEQFLLCFRPKESVEARLFTIFVCRLHDKEIKNGFTVEQTENFHTLESAMMRAGIVEANETNYTFNENHMIFITKFSQGFDHDVEANIIWANANNLEEITKFFNNGKEEDK